jgi:hypothetical protein
MAAVLIVCPRSGASVSTGLSLDPEGLRALSPRVMRMRCSSCGSEHAWAKGLAFLSAEPVASPAPVLLPVTIGSDTNRSRSAGVRQNDVPSSSSLQARLDRIDDRMTARILRAASLLQSLRKGSTT